MKNKELADKIKATIRKYPRAFDMRDYFTTTVSSEDALSMLRLNPKCGLQACIGGWACVLSDVNDFNDFPVGLMAQRLLGLNSNKLFYLASWPDVLESEYRLAWCHDDYSGMVEAACKAIDHFMES
jgi:hypothetical protein